MILIPFILGIEATNLVDVNTFYFGHVRNTLDTLLTSMGTKLTGPHIEQKLQFDSLLDGQIDVIIERNNIARLPYEKFIANLKAKINEKNKVPYPIYLVTIISIILFKILEINLAYALLIFMGTAIIFLVFHGNKRNDISEIIFMLKNLCFFLQ